MDKAWHGCDVSTEVYHQLYDVCDILFLEIKFT